jgi:hypothetical protein
MGINESLKEKTEILILQLVKYAEIDPEVLWVYERMKPLLDAILRGEVTPPQNDDFRRYFFDVESHAPWTDKYPELTRAEAEYASVLQGWS